MTRAWGLVPLLAATSVLLGAAKQPAPMEGAQLYAIGVVTPDLQKTLDEYERVLGVVPGIRVAPPAGSAIAQSSGAAAARRPGGGVVEPDGKKVDFKLNAVFFPNFYIKVFQPISANGPYSPHLKQYGMSIQDAQFKIGGDMNVIRAALVRLGGRWTLGSDRDPWSYVDFQKSLGITLEPINSRPQGTMLVAPGAKIPVGAMPVSRVGFVVSDVRAAAEAYSKVFGMPMPHIDEVQLGYPPGASGKGAAHLRIARWKQGDIGIELVQPMGGPSPWRDFLLKEKGNAAHHVTIDVGDHFSEVLEDLRAKGGKWIYGTANAGLAGLDFTDTLGLVIEIQGSPRSPGKEG